MPVSEEQHKALEMRVSAGEARLSANETAIAVDKVTGQVIIARLDKMEDTQTWLVRLIIGTLVTAAVYLALTGGLGGQQ